MMNHIFWESTSKKLPPEGKLVLCWFNNLRGYGLRRRRGDDWYDENDDLDDSEIPIELWVEIQPFED